MPEPPFDIRKALEQSTSRTTLQELARKGIHRVKVLNEQKIQELIRDAVQHSIASKTSLLSEQERERLVQATRQELDKLIREFNQQKDRAELAANDKATLAAEVENLQKQLQVQRQLGDQLARVSYEDGRRAAAEQLASLEQRLEERVRDAVGRREAELRSQQADLERDYNQKLMAEMQKNVELSQKMTSSLEESRAHEDDLVRKMEQLFTKSMEGLSKKLSDLRLRTVAGPAGSSGFTELEGVELRPSQATIETLFNQELESNVKAMQKSEGKVGGKLGSALDRLKALRGGGGGKPDEPEKK
ncbi:MAG: hypothetical protein HY716_13025 [Planctomycetes bacterium]|nr:hypothetical protein [Planctomycetota bacterium]